MAKTPEQEMKEILSRTISSEPDALLSEIMPAYTPQLRSAKPKEKKQIAVQAPRETSFLEDVGQFIEERPMLKNTLSAINAPSGATITELTNLLNRQPLGQSASQFLEGASGYLKQKYEENPASVFTAPFAAPLAGLVSVGEKSKTGLDLSKALYAAGARARGVDFEASQRLAEQAAKEYPKIAFTSGLASEIAIDPLNLVGFGATSATKAGLKAAQQAAKDIAKETGLTATKVEDVPEAIYQATKQRYQAMGNLPVLQQGTDRASDRIETLASNARKAAQKRIEDAAKAARLKAQNALISLDIPFTNLSKTFIQKPERFRVKAEGTGEVGQRIVNQLFTPPVGLEGKSLADYNDNVSNFLFDTYGTRNAAELTVEEIRDLQRRFEQAGGRTTSKTFGLETVKKVKEVPDIQTADVSTPFLFDEFIKKYSPEVQDLSRRLLREGMTPQQIISDLPALMRQAAETSKQKTIIPPSVKPLPKNIGDKLDELFYFSQLAGKPIGTYEEGFKQILDFYNRPDVSEQNITDFLDEAIVEAKRPLQEAEAGRVAQQTKQAEQIAAENVRLQKEYENALASYNEAKSTYQTRKKEAKTQAEKEQLVELDRRVKKWEDTVARLRTERTKQKTQAKVKVSAPAPKAPAPAPKLTPFEQAKAKNLADDDALLVDEYAHYLKVSGLTDEAVAQKVTSFVASLSRNPDAMRKELARLIAEQKRNLSSNMPTGKKVLELAKDQPQSIWKPLLDKIKSPEIANLIQEIPLREVGLLVKSNIAKSKDFRVATFNFEENGAPAFLSRRQKLVNEIVKALDEGASEADILAKLERKKALPQKLGDRSANKEKIDELVKDRRTVVQEVDELKPVLPRGMEYKPPTGVKEAPTPKPEATVAEKIGEVLKPKRGQGLTFKKPAKVVEEVVPTKPQPKRGKGLVFKKPEKIVEKIAEDLKPQPKRGEGLKFKPPEKPLVDPKQKGADGFSSNLLEAINDGMSRFGLDLSDYFGENLYAPIVKGYKKDYENQYVDFNNIADANRYYRIFEQGSLNDAKYFIHQEDKRVYMFSRDGKQIESAFKSSFPKEYAKSRMARLEQPKLKFKPPVKEVEAPEWAKSHAKDVGGSITYHDGDVALIRGYSSITGKPVFVGAKGYSRTQIDIGSYTGNLFSKEELQKLTDAKKKWLEADAKAFAENPDGPFKKGEIFAHSDNVPKEIQEIVKQWQKMLGITERIYLSTLDDAKVANYPGDFSSIPSQTMDAYALGSKRRLPNGAFSIVYTPSSKSTIRTLETISHEIGHALMDTRYAEASPEVRKAIDDEYEKWLASTKGKTAQELAKSLRAYKSGKETRMREELKADDINRYDYWKSKSEWFADQVSRWATTNEKPVSVVEKFFSRLAKVMKQFFQANKQYLASKTMEDWLNGLEKSAKTNQVQPFGDTKISESRSKIDLQSGNIDIELPKRPTKKDIPLVIEQIAEVIKPKKPVLAKVPKVEPPKAIELPKEKRAELRKMREAMQPSAEPRIIKGLDAKFANEMKRAATALEKQKPVKVETLKEPKGTMQIEEVRTKKGAKPIRAEKVPFHRLRQEGAFQRDAGGVSTVGKILRDSALFRMFNARSLGTGNSFLDSYGGLIQDASTRISGETRFIRRDLVDIQKAAEGLTPEQMLGVQYVIENRFPKNMSEADQQAILSNPKVQKVAELSKKLLAYLGAEERTAGVLKNLRKDYFPHLLKFNAQDAEEFAKRYRNDPDLRDLAKGLSQKAGFSMERRGLPTLAEYDDKLLELETKMNQADSPSIRDDYMRKINALQDLFNRDTVNALSSRVYQSVRSRAMKDLYDQMKTDGMIRYGKTVPKGYTALSPKQAGLLGIDKRTAEGGVSMNDDVLRGLEKVEGFFKDENMNSFVKTLDDLTRLWKLGTTMLIPRHYVNNLIGNAFNNGLAGVKIDSYVEATKKIQTIAKKKIDDMTPAEREEIVQLYRDGVIGQGINAEFRTAEQLAERSILQRMSDWAQKTWYGRNVMYIGEMVDDWSRLALYLHAKKVTNSHKMAVDTVRKYLFNYHELTQADRFVRSTMMPFWLWMKHNIPLQFQQFLRQPRYYVTAEKIREATFEDDELSEQPEYIREKGFKLFGQTYAINLPMYDLYVINGVQGTAKNIINMFGPLQTFLPEIVTNKDVFTEAPISRELSRGKQEDYSTSDIAKYLTRQFGGAVGGDLLELYKNVFEEERLTGAEQAKRSALGFFLPKPALQE